MTHPSARAQTTAPGPAQRRSWIAIAVVGVLAGIAQMGLWLLIAPRQQWVQYARDGSALVLPTEDVYRFTSIAIFSMLSIVIGVVLAVAAWQLRSARGPVMLLAGAAGLAAGSALALWWGPLLAGGDYPWELLAREGKPAVDRIVTFPPTISWVTVILSPLFFVLVYTFVATWQSDPGLGAREFTDSSGQRAPADQVVGAAAAGNPAGVAAPADVTAPAVGTPRTGRSPGTW